MQTAHVGIVVLNWNGAADTLECVRSLQAGHYPRQSIFIVDNGSTDDSLSRLRTLGDSVETVTNPVNEGFSGGMNRGAEAALAAGVDYVLLLNNDTVVDADFLARLVDTYAETGIADAVIAPAVYHYDDPDELTPTAHYWDYDEFRFVPAEGAPGWRTDAANEVDHLVAAAVLVPAHLIHKHGLFDPRFFLNWEETDWEFRLRKAGVKLFAQPRSVIRHKVSRSFRGALHHLYYFERNRLLWIEKNFSRSERRRICLRHEIPRKYRVVRRLAIRSLARPLLALAGRRDKAAATADKIRENKVAIRAWQAYFRGEFGKAPDNLGLTDDE